MNCPKCGTLAYPQARKCHACGERLAWTPAPLKDTKPLPPDLEQNLTALGFSREPGETPADFAARCRMWMLDRFVRHGCKRDQAA
jgi:hypothetical protein